MGIGVQELLIILVIVGLVFGTKKLKNIGSDLGGAIKGFRDAFREGESNSSPGAETKKQETMIEGDSDSGSEKEQKHSE